MLPSIRISKELALPDTDQWQFRFNVRSETSNRLYTIAQNKRSGIGVVVARHGNATGIANTWMLLVSPVMRNLMK